MAGGAQPLIIEPSDQRTSKIQNGQNGRWGLQIGLPPDFWALSLTFAKQVCDLSTPSMRKVDDREKRENND